MALLGRALSLLSSLPQPRAQGYPGPVIGALQKGGEELPGSGKGGQAELWAPFPLDTLDFLPCSVSLKKGVPLSKSKF